MEINKYKFTITSGYITSFHNVLSGEYDWVGQASQYPELAKGYYQWVNGQIVADTTKKAEIEAEEAKQNEIAELKQKLIDTDYIWNCINEGDRTEEYYAEVIANRHTWRMRIRELEGE